MNTRTHTNIIQTLNQVTTITPFFIFLMAAASIILMLEKKVKTPCCRDTHSHKHRELWEPNQTCLIRCHDLSYVMILPRNFKVSGFSGAKMQMMSLCVKISSKDLDTILCFRQESVEDHEENKEGFLTGFFVSFGKTPIATYSYCHHLSDSFPLPDATDLFQVAHRAIPDRLVVDPWRMQWEYNENAMSKCHFWSEYIWIKQCKTWIGLLGRAVKGFLFVLTWVRHFLFTTRCQKLMEIDNGIYHLSIFIYCRRGWLVNRPWHQASPPHHGP